MRQRLWHGIATLGCVIALAACGSTVTAGPGGAQGTPNTSSPTKSSGPIVIETDHAIYAPTDLIQVTLTNGLTTALYSADHQASCSIFTIESQVNGAWQPVESPLAGCAQGRPTTIVKVAPGATYHATIQAGYLRQGDHSFPSGQYRIVLNYTNTPPAIDTGSPPTGEATPVRNTVYSVTLTIDPHVQAEPIPTNAPGSGSAGGTPATVVP